MVGDDVPEFVALLLGQWGDAARGVAPAGGVFEGDAAVGVDRCGFEQLFAAPQVLFADNMFFAVAVARIVLVAAAENCYSALITSSAMTKASDYIALGLAFSCQLFRFFRMMGTYLKNHYL
ncbi:hypothetical protein GV819_31040 [Pseudomonas sp. Fl5BN2]|uniref:hypothetical protein n=1 Tax=Pseudomonas sp. Fl5BN2 TaxID=2697652 RepID=UPI001377E70D|nr:hypothetical protein [Pseudomonas sp. Fl5BN2]NBF06711.1 hypothetical protein [Pseudomonas sp. Fl5BN2]